MAIRRNPVKPHIRRAIRTALGVGIACSLGYGLVLPLEGMPNAANIAAASKWAAITCVLVTVPVLGQVSKVGFERSLGTVIGGVLGYLTFEVGSRVWNDDTDGYFLAVMGAIFAFCCTMLANRLKLDLSMKLCMTTFVLVTFGAGDEGARGALELAITRTSGIVSGVFLSLLLSVVVFPKSASMEAIWETKNALDSLCKLGDICWKSQSIFRKELLHSITSLPPGAATIAAAAAAGYEPLPAADPGGGGTWPPGAEGGGGGSGGFMARVEDLYCREAENRLNDLYNKLARAAEMSEQSSNEILVGIFRNRWCFLPGLSCLKRPAWKAFRTDLGDAGTHLRKLSRLLWTLHLNFEEGFNENMRAVLKQQFPAGLLVKLVETCQGTLQDLAGAFPNGRNVPTRNLRMFVQSVDGLVAISDYYRRRILYHMTEYKYFNTRTPDTVKSKLSAEAAQAAVEEAEREANAQHAAKAASRVASALGQLQLGGSGSNGEAGAAGGGGGGGPMGGEGAPMRYREPSAMDLKGRSDDEEEDAHAHPGGGSGHSGIAGGGSAAQVQPLLSVYGVGEEQGEEEEELMQQPLTSFGSRLSVGSSASGSGRHLTSFGSRASVGSGTSGSGRHRLGGSGGSGSSRHRGGLHGREGSSGGPLDSAAEAGSGPAASAVAIGPAHSSPSYSSLPGGGHHDVLEPLTLNDEFVGSPTDAFDRLQDGVRIRVASRVRGGLPGTLQEEGGAVGGSSAGSGGGGEGGPGQGPGPPGRPQLSTYQSFRGTDLGFSVNLRPVPSEELALFPETAEGHVSQVRWYSFQMLMMELAEELQETVASFDRLLAKIRAVEADDDGWVWM